MTPNCHITEMLHTKKMKNCNFVVVLGDVCEGSIDPDVYRNRCRKITRVLVTQRREEQLVCTLNKRLLIQTTLDDIRRHLRVRIPELEPIESMNVTSFFFFEISLKPICYSTLLLHFCCSLDVLFLHFSFYF